MKKIYRAVALCFLLSLIPLVGYILCNTTKPSHQEPPPHIDVQDTHQTPPVLPPEEKIFEQMTLEERVGQLFIFGIDGTQILDPSVTQFLSHTHPGGIILFQKNIQNENQLKSFTSLIQSTTKIPMFIAIDQEGGTVHRLEWSDTLTLSPKQIDTPQQAYSIGLARGKILRNLGINMNMAPVAEYTVSPTSFIYPRTFDGNLDEVVQKSSSMIRGYKISGVIPVPKHFPGHGENNVDPHENIVNVDIQNTQWNQYIKPFSILLQNTDVDAIMVGHIRFPSIDNLPSSISYEIITNRLIKGLNYNGVVISDAMEMKSISSFGTQEQLAFQALSAGEDILIYSKYGNNVYDYILQQVEQGNLNIDEKVKKILRLKMQYNILDTTNLPSS